MQPGSIIGGRYQLVDVVAEGGLSTVWQGVSRATEVFARPVAIKVMKRQFSTIGGPYLSMFLEEARIGAQLQHANLIQVLDLIVETTLQGPVYCLVLEWVDGTDLKTLLKKSTEAKQQLPWLFVATIAVRVLRGLAAAHERVGSDGKPAPVLHRDCSPQNVLLARNGDVKLADFGMALARDRIAEHTAPGFVKGTLSYLAPELITGHPASPVSDLFSFSATLWEALANERLFQAKTDVEVVALLRKCEIPLIADRRTDVPGGLSVAIRKALNQDPAQRFPSTRAMAHQIADIIRTEAPTHDPDEVIANTVREFLAK